MAQESSVLSASEEYFGKVNQAAGRTEPLSGSWLDRLTRRAVWRQLDGLQYGCLTIAEGGQVRSFGDTQDDSLRATIQVSDPRFYWHTVTGGHLGASEAYLRGEWSCDDLVALIRIFSRNAAVLDSVERGVARLLKPLQVVAHRLRRNTRSGSRRNIAAHYDLSNEFYSLFLDDTMTYSCGIFPRPDASLREASLEKYARICRKLELSPGDHVVEVGGGWGGFALVAAGQYGCRVTTTTISEQQYQWASARIREAGLTDRITLLKQDYRDLQGQFDKLVSIEMIEAVGHEYLPAYFTKCCRLLKPAGMMLLQAITIPDERYDAYRRSADFIQRYIFPGGCLPSLSAISHCLKQTDFRLFHLEDFGSHYVRTLLEWRRRFWERIDRVRALGLSEEFVRMWDLYLCYCAGAFDERQIGVSQILLTKPRCRREAILATLPVAN
ncbi:MAG: cyclopropane-fatty-acyl-phospholipid synthase family protein [Pirellulaceae bacterium]|nr:cyclopropane-fatty-acyl-phospholipid synthase family protein [Pirellulaceae bacterium]